VSITFKHFLSGASVANPNSPGVAGATTSSNVGLIAGVVVGGFFLLLIIFALVFYFVIRPRLLGNNKKYQE